MHVNVPLVAPEGPPGCAYNNNERLYDLLHPETSPPAVPQPSWKSSHVRASEVQAARRRHRSAVREVLQGDEFLSRLAECCERHIARGARGYEGDNIIAAMCARIETLNSEQVFQEQLRQMDGEMKKEYSDLFPDDIPPVHHLPDQVYHRFRLKDASKIVS